MKNFNIDFKAAETPVHAFLIQVEENVSELLENAATGLTAQISGVY